jgi:hypothetical protein
MNLFDAASYGLSESALELDPVGANATVPEAHTGPCSVQPTGNSEYLALFCEMWFNLLACGQ